MEEVAMMAFNTLALRNFVSTLDVPVSMSSVLLDKHFLRKHGENSYYGQG